MSGKCFICNTDSSRWLKKRGEKATRCEARRGEREAVSEPVVIYRMEGKTGLLSRPRLFAMPRCGIKFICDIYDFKFSDGKCQFAIYPRDSVREFFSVSRNLGHRRELRPLRSMTSCQRVYGGTALCGRPGELPKVKLRFSGLGGLSISQIGLRYNYRTFNLCSTL